VIGNDGDGQLNAVRWRHGETVVRVRCVVRKSS
jgi:hypothetical protein